MNSNKSSCQSRYWFKSIIQHCWLVVKWTFSQMCDLFTAVQLLGVASIAVCITNLSKHLSCFIYLSIKLCSFAFPKSINLQLCLNLSPVIKSEAFPKSLSIKLQYFTRSFQFIEVFSREIIHSALFTGPLVLGYNYFFRK